MKIINKFFIRTTVVLISVFYLLSSNAWADLSNEVKWNTNIVVVETAIKAGDYKEAFILLQEPAKAGHAKSQYYMGMFYHNGLGTINGTVKLPYKEIKLPYKEVSLWHYLGISHYGRINNAHTVCRICNSHIS